jgi:hypothetical protein
MPMEYRRRRKQPTFGCTRLPHVPYPGDLRPEGRKSKVRVNCWCITAHYRHGWISGETWDGRRAFRSALSRIRTRRRSSRAFGSRVSRRARRSLSSSVISRSLLLGDVAELSVRLHRVGLDSSPIQAWSAVAIAVLTGALIWFTRKYVKKTGEIVTAQRDANRIQERYLERTLLAEAPSSAR